MPVFYRNTVFKNAHFSFYKNKVYKNSDAEVSSQAVQPVLLVSLKLSMAVYGQKLDGQPSR